MPRRIRRKTSSFSDGAPTSDESKTHPMSDSTFQQPSPQDLDGFIEGDPLATDRVVTLLADQLVRWAKSNYTDLSDPDIEDLVYAALEETCRNHAGYDPSRSLITTYVINLIKWRAQRVRGAVRKIRDHEDTSPEAQEKLPRGVYNQAEAKDIEVRIAREDFYRTAREKLEGLDREFFELEIQGAEWDDYVRAVEREGSFPNPDAEAKNRRARLRRALKKIAEDMGFEVDDFSKE